MFTLRCGIGRISPHSFLRMNVSLTALARIRAIGEVELGIAIAACHSDVSPTPASGLESRAFGASSEWTRWLIGLKCKNARRERRRENERHAME
jgi:hypothetical protein